MRKFFFLLYLLILITVFCTSDNISSGGTDIANSYAEIHVVDAAGSSVENINVTLMGVIITETGDSNFYLQTRASNNYGIATFDEIPDGHYAAIANDSINNKGAILSKITIEGDSITVSKSLTLKSKSPLKGRIVNRNDLSNISIVVPGIEGKIAPDSNGFYVIDNMFRGEYDICFVSDSIVNYLNISVKDSVIDTIYIRDINFAETLNEKSVIYNYYEDDMAKSYQIEPQYYAPQDEPLWYEDHDFSIVDYIKTEEDPLYIWRYPILVGVSDTTLRYYGNDSIVIVTLIKDQINKVSDVFNMANLSGKIEFSVDSVYFFSGNVDLEKIATPQDFSLRLLYEANRDSTEIFANWITAERVATYAFRPNEYDGFFGKVGLAYLTMMFGWSRGTIYLIPMNVKNINNEVNGDSFIVDDYVMSKVGAQEWSATNSMIIDYSGNSLHPSPDIAYERFPHNISLKTVDSSLVPLGNVNVEVFVNRKSDNSLADTVIYGGLTNSEGLFTFTENPFMDIVDTTERYNNLLIRTIYNGDTSYNWFPKIEVVDSCFINAPTTYTKQIIIP